MELYDIYSVFRTAFEAEYQTLHSISTISFL